MRLIILNLLSLGITPSVVGHSGPHRQETQNLNNFLESNAINPAAINGETRHTGGVHLACAILEASNQTAVVFPSDGELYTQIDKAHASATAPKNPACIYTPNDVKGVSLGVKVATFVQAKFAIRSGGHSPMEYFANIDGGVLISLAGIKTLEYNADTQTQRSGFGNLWQDVYRHVNAQGRTVVGGRTGSVGLALTLGGGLSHFSNAYGWAAQNVLSYEMVLADGSIVIASEEENSDLYFAVKAGANNFGIVTHIVQRTYPLGKIWGGSMIFPGNASAQFMAALADYQAKGQLDKKSAILPYVGLIADAVVAQFSYLEPVERPEAFEAFYDIPVIQDLTQVWDTFAAMVTAPIPYNMTRFSYATTDLLYDKEAYLEIERICHKYIPRMRKLEGGDIMLMPQPISVSMVGEARARGSDPMGVADQPQLWFVVSSGWNLAQDDAEAESIMLDALAEVEEYTKSRALHLPFYFLNDAFSTQMPLQSYGAVTYGKLQAASRKYDPTRVFQELVPGGFKLV
uniref:Bifunctional solanapyrone synthase n=1 Tax=Alternaria solani TaxID=48100 RepID=SOL5_ALTSO|nr:RecName: Full=Bifunctional solanapyrone synthase; AltName: Full=FAD-dependent monooxygenase sol5; AltName: Full=Prosolanapyrone-II oxidase; AltName: Full=Prosolanapyrone-III cycloisomerase; AltName: Full=Solanapyrone biosynthesis protein 5; Flags: Precursor [Alternaria solani]BAJ09785.1 oxidase/Diels-Alderase [Alternaria solani]